MPAVWMRLVVSRPMSLVVVAVLAGSGAGVRQGGPADDDQRREHEEDQQATARAGRSQGLHALFCPRSHAPNYRHERAVVKQNVEIASGSCPSRHKSHAGETGSFDSGPAPGPTGTVKGRGCTRRCGMARCSGARGGCLVAALLIMTVAAAGG